MLLPTLPSFSALVLLSSLSSLLAPPALARALPEVPVPKHIGAEARQWTNGQRLAAGLPPHAPRKLKRATPTEPNVARRHAPSPSPSRAAFASLPVYVRLSLRLCLSLSLGLSFWPLRAFPSWS